MDELPPSTAILIAHDSIGHRKESVVTAPSYVVAGMDACTALTHENGAARNRLTTVPLDTEILGI